MTLATSRYKRGSENLGQALAKSIASSLKPPPVLTLSEWADEYAYLSPEGSSEPGKFKAYGYQRGMLDAITDPTVKKVTFMKSARVGYSRALCHAVGYYIHQDPSPMLIVQPGKEKAKKFSRIEIAPMLRDTPVLRELTGTLDSKNRNQTLALRMFQNGASINFIGSNSPDELSGLTVKVVMFDEVDRYKVEGAGDDGDQILLGTRRTETFWDNKIILGSTPLLKGSSIIEKSYQEGDQRHFYVPCPHCNRKQVLKWQNMSWDKDTETDEYGKVKVLKHYPRTAFFWCEGEGCNKAIEEHHKLDMIEKGEWIAHEPFNGHASFHIWTAYSPNANAAWGAIVENWLECQGDPGRLKTFVNLTLGETWEEQGEKLESGSLIERREAYDGDSLPDGVRLITAGVDTQTDRLECEIIGWGAREEAWVIKTEVLHGDPAQPHVWGRLKEVLRQKFVTVSGRKLGIRASCIDTGGDHTERVYAFTKTHGKSLNLFNIKGASTRNKPVWPKRASKVGKNGTDTLYMIGTDTAKGAIHSRLKIEQPGPGYIHFSYDCDQEFFDQLTAEKLTPRYSKGVRYQHWEKTRDRNEAWDMFVYAFAALKSTGLNLDKLSPPQAMDNESALAPTAPDQPSEPLAPSAKDIEPISIAPPMPSEVTPAIKQMTLAPTPPSVQPKFDQKKRRPNPFGDTSSWFR